jgi:glycosyltransferase involved in cell wall biosynthesis
MARDVIFNRDVLRDCGVYFDKDPKILAKRMQWTLDNPNDLQEFKKKAMARILDNYSWDKVADKYERLFCDVVGGKYIWLSRRKEASE